MFQWKEDVLFGKMLQAISRTTGPNIGLFVFILMHFPIKSSSGEKVKKRAKKVQIVFSINYL